MHSKINSRFCYLEDHSILEISGKDAQSFLQGQLTTDLLKLDLGQNSLTSVCSHTGKVIALVRLCKINVNLFYCIANQSNLEHFQQHLKKYAIFSKVTFKFLTNLAILNFKLENLQKTPFLIQYIQDNFTQDLEELEPEQSFIQEENLLIFTNDLLHSYYLIANKEKLDHLVNALETKAELPAITIDAYYAELLSREIPILNIQFVDKFIAQALNLDNLEACVSFSKGCYQGQEGIARARYRGTNKLTLKAFIYPDFQQTKYFATEQMQQEFLMSIIGKQIFLELEDNKHKPTGTIIHALFLDNDLFIQTVLPINENSQAKYYLLAPDTHSDLKALNYLLYCPVQNIFNNKNYNKD